MNVPFGPSMRRWLRFAPAVVAGAAIVVAPLATGASSAGATAEAAAFAEVISVSCPSTTECIAVGLATYNLNSGASTAGVLYSSDAGDKWSVGKVPSGYSAIYGVHCTSKTDCYATAASDSGAGAFLYTKNADAKTGPTWSKKALPNASGGTFSSPNAISCPSASECIVVGGSENGTEPAIVKASISKTDAVTLSAMAIPSAGTTAYPTSGLFGVSCSSTTFCIAVGYNPSDQGGAFKYSSGHWSLVTSLPSSLTSLQGADCVVKSDDCYVVAASNFADPPVGDIYETTDSGSKWTKQTLPKGTAGIYSISCVSTADCAAVGYDSAGKAEAVSKKSGTRFLDGKVPSNDGPMYTVDCLSTKMCVAGGNNSEGNVAQIMTSTNFSTWTGRTA